MNNIACSKCGSDKVIGNVKVLDRGEYNNLFDLQVSVQILREKSWFPDGVQSKVSASVCGDCGYIDLYAASPKELYTAYQNYKKEGLTE